MVQEVAAGGGQGGGGGGKKRKNQRKKNKNKNQNQNQEPGTANQNGRRQSEREEEADRSRSSSDAGGTGAVPPTCGQNVSSIAPAKTEPIVNGFIEKEVKHDTEQLLKNLAREMNSCPLLRYNNWYQVQEAEKMYYMKKAKQVRLTK